MSTKDIGRWILIVAAASLLAQLAVMLWQVTLVVLAAWGASRIPGWIRARRHARLTPNQLADVERRVDIAVERQAHGVTGSRGKVVIFDRARRIRS